MDLSRMHKDDLEDILCDMLEELSHDNENLYHKYKKEIEDAIFCIEDDEAINIVKNMKPYGEVFSHTKVDEILSRHNTGNLDDDIEYYLCMNMFYNDYKAFIELKRLDPQDFCYEMSKLFIEDADAPNHKVAKYFNMFIEED